MKRTCLRVPFLLVSLLLLQPLYALGGAAEKLFYGFEVSGRLVGYVEATIEPPEEPGEPRRMTSVLFAKMTLLGQDFDLRVDESYALDPVSGEVLRHRRDTSMGTTRLQTSVEVRGNEAHVSSGPGEAPKVVSLDGDVILEDSIHLDHVLRELKEPGAAKVFRVLDDTSGEIRDVRYVRGSDGTFPLEGSERPCAVFEVTVESVGFSGEAWLDRTDGRILRVTLPGGVALYRTSAAVVGMIERAEIDDLLLAPVDVAIADFPGITYLKVEARFRTTGEPVSAESLNVPGQTFTGTVEGNLVDGVFEISIPRYGGEGAPPFPPALGADDPLLVHLEPELLIEADDPVLRELAQQLTAGSADSWEAARRLSEWVDREIVYEIPGGSARSTFDARKGECGSHSRLLVAFCRGVGIPARIASGCMYSPARGGSFVQHAWVEVHLGEAGWIPVDPTAHETDYVDSGHLRVGSRASFQPETMKILDHRVRSLEGTARARLGSFWDAPWKTGKTFTYSYTRDGFPLGKDSFTVESRTEVDGRRVISCRTKLELIGLASEGSFRLDGDGHPIDYHVKGRAGTGEFAIDCEFRPGIVIEKVTQGSRETERSIDLPEEVYLLDNNNFSGYAFLLAAVPREEGTVVSFPAFHPSSMQVLSVQITVGGMEEIEIEWGGARVKTECRRCDLVIAGTPLKLWLDAEGRVLRESEAGGRLVLTLVSAGK